MDSTDSVDGVWMLRCKELARQASEAGNTPVGSVVVIEGTMIAGAAEETPRGDRHFAHAELLAIEAAIRAVGLESLGRSTLYSTAEPCILCGYAIRDAGIGRVVIGRPSGDIGSVRGAFPVLTTEEVEDWGPPPEIVWWSDEPKGE